MTRQHANIDPMDKRQVGRRWKTKIDHLSRKKIGMKRKPIIRKMQRRMGQKKDHRTDCDVVTSCPTSRYLPL
jgi:hypothetical protein